MDFVKNLTGGGNNNANNDNQPQATGSEQKSEGGFLGGIGNKLNNAAGGGAEGEKKEDGLDKGIDYVQENFLGQGKQDNESAIEQAKDEQISDFIRGQYKGQTGKDFPIADK
ncbi:hypothetical protein Q7P35_011555 [Cladosporium inversicolor]